MSRCPKCGREASGKYCSNCGTPLEATRYCSSCGSPVEGDDLFCAECGAPTGPRPRKPLRAYLPWILSGLALVFFAVAITFFVRGQATPRAEGAPPTGGVIDETGGAGAAAGGAPAAGAQGQAGMPSMEELQSMGPREAADRLFERSMQLEESGTNREQAQFFARMGLRAYSQVPPSEIDADARFHIGLLELEGGQTAAAAAEADTILADQPNHLLGLLLAARAAEAAGDSGRSAREFRRFLQSAGTTDLDSRPEYQAHRELIRSVRDSLEAAGVSG